MKYKDFYSELFLENLQLAEKVYFSTGILNEKWKNFILKITNGDYTTKVISDIIADKVKSGRQHELVTKELEKIYIQARDYNKNVFPIYGFSYENRDGKDYSHELLIRQQVIESFKKLPEIAGRNLRGDIRIQRNWEGLNKLKNTLEYIHPLLHQLNNRPEEIKNKMFRKIFSSENQTFDDVARFLEEKDNVIGGKEFTRKDMGELIEKHGTPIVYDKNNVVVLDITSKQEIHEFGCMGLWCFTYGSHSEYSDDYKVFDSYSTNGHVYLIIDFKSSPESADFMYVLIKPIPEQLIKNYYDENLNKTFDFYRQNSYEDFKVRKKYEEDYITSLYDMTNSAEPDPIHTINNMTRGDKEIFKVFTFDEV